MNKAAYYHKIIAKAVKKHATQAGGVYVNEITDATKLNKKVICRWLKENGFAKYGGKGSRYWQPVIVTEAPVQCTGAEA